ncbi:MAG: transport permease protein [Gemmatimonadota bacterium]|nr:MAG: transport permease protein [Gemmatimonadota bacterium]
MNPPRAFERVYEMVRKEFLQVRRDPRLRGVILVAPVIQLVVFGYAVSTDVRMTATVVVDHDRTRASRELIEAFTSSGYFHVEERARRPADIMNALDAGDAVLGIEIPAGFSSDLESGVGAGVQLLFDGTNSNVASIAQGYAERIVQDYGAKRASMTVPPSMELRERAWFNPDLDSRDYNVPAVIGSIMLLVCLLLTSLAVVREREIGTLEQLMVSPLTPFELVAGKTIPFALIGLVNLAIVAAVSILWFDVPFRGSLAVLLFGSILYLLSALGIGLFISTISRTQQEAFMGSFLVFMPAILLSGFMFPVSSMPTIFQWLTLLNPLRHYLEIVRGVFLKGAGIEHLWTQHLALLVMGVVILAVAAGRFRKRVG